MIGRKYSIHSFWNYSGMKGAVQGACLSPPYDAQEQGPLEELPGGINQGKKHRVCQRVETGSTHKPKDMERWTVKGWKKTVHPKESRGDCYIRQNKLKEKKVQWDKYCMMIKWSIYQKAVTSKYIYTSNIRYLRKMKQTLNWHVQITRPNKSRKHMYLKDTENILYERPR